MFAFNTDFDCIVGEDNMRLQIIEQFPGNDVLIPYYYYDIYVGEQRAGKISIRIGENYHSYYNGNVGYEIHEAFRGHRYSLAALRLVLPVAAYHGMQRLLLTCRQSNAASRRIIELAGGKLLETVVPPQDYFGWYESIGPQCIYTLDVSGKSAGDSGISNA